MKDSIVNSAMRKKYKIEFLLFNKKINDFTTEINK